MIICMKISAAVGEDCDSALLSLWLTREMDGWMNGCFHSSIINILFFPPLSFLLFCFSFWIPLTCTVLMNGLKPIPAVWVPIRFIRLKFFEYWNLKYKAGESIFFFIVNKSHEKTTTYLTLNTLLCRWSSSSYWRHAVNYLKQLTNI